MRSLALLVVIMIGPCAAHAAQPPTVRAWVDRDEITIGDRFIFTVEVSREPEVELLTPLSTIGSHLPHFQVKDIRRPDSSDEAGRLVEGLEYELSTYVSGAYPIPPLMLAYRMPDGATGTLMTDVMTIHVKSVLPLDDTAVTLRDIRPPRVAPRGTEWLRSVGLLAAGILLLLAAIGGVAYWLLRRPKKPKPKTPAHIVALGRLAKLRNGPAYQQEDAKAFALELSEIVRRYLGDRWGYNAIDLTTSEIARDLPGGDVPQAWHEAINAALRACDLAKFAGLPLGRTQMTLHLEQMVRFVAETAADEVTPPPASVKQPPEVVHG